MKFVVCVNNENYPASLEKNKIYRISEESEKIPKDQISVIDESGESYIFDSSLFKNIEINKELEKALIT